MPKNTAKHAELWSEMTQVLPRLWWAFAARFPQAEQSQLALSTLAPGQAVDYLAKHHDLTEPEVCHGLRDVLSIGALARDTADLRQPLDPHARQ